MRPAQCPSIGIIGFGAFGQFMARHLAPHAAVLAYDPAWKPAGVDAISPCATLEAVASAPVVILAVPVSCLGEAAARVAPHLRPGALVLDVGSVKTEPAAALLAALPLHVDILATHPLFGPQSARDRLAGHKVVLCPVRGRRTATVARFLRRLGLDVIVTTADAHDRELATVQGLTHLVGRLVADMGPLPTRLTTRSFDRLVEAAAMVAADAPEVFHAILCGNPHAGPVRARFFGAAARLQAELGRV